MISALDKICPAFIIYYLRVISVYFSKWFGKKQKSYDGINQLEEEQFSITSLPPDTIRNHELPPDLPQSSAHSFAYPIGPPEQDSPSKSIRLAESDQFKINLDPYDKYYEMIESKTRNIHDLFQQSQKQVDLDLTTNRTDFHVYDCPANTGFKFIFTFKLPCSYAFYHGANCTVKTVSQFSRNIDSFQLLETIYPNLSIYGLSFKKIIGLGLEPRKFTYLKYVNNATQTSHWQVATSLNTGQAYHSSSAVKQAQIFSISHIKQTVQEGRAKINAKIYVELDLRSIIRAPKIVAKGLREVGHYLENFYQHVENNYHQQTA